MTTKITSSVLANTTVTSGTYGGSTQHSVVTVDAQGRITYAANATPSIANTQITGTITSTQIASITSTQVTTALGFTPYNATNPNGYQTSSGSVASATNATTATTATTANTLNTGNSYQVAALGVNTAAPGTGAIRATGDITGFYSSDEKFKENIQPITNAIEIASTIGGKTFDWTDEYINTHGGEDGYFVQKSDFGVIAQDVQKVFPLAVRTREDGSLAVDYAKLSALAFAAIADLQKQIDELKGR